MSNLENLKKMISQKEYEYIKCVHTKFNKIKINVVDVGANKGYYSQQILDVFEDNIEKIYAFEPVPRFYDIITNKFKENSLIETINSACSDEKRKDEFYEIIDLKDEDAEGLSSLNFREVYNNFKYSKIEVDCIKLDDFILDNSINKIEFMKIDTEGHELSVLLGAKKSLENGLFDFIQIEYGNCIREAGKDLIDIFNLLDSTEYRIYDLINGVFLEIGKEGCEKRRNVGWDNYLISKHKLD